MTTDLHTRLEIYRTWIVVLVVLVVGLFVLVGVNQVQIARMQAVRLGMIAAAHQRHVNIEQLCEAVNDQEHIIRRELPLVQMSWTAGLREVCK